VNCACYLFGICLVGNRIITKGNVTDYNVHIIVRNVGFLKALYSYVSIGVKVFCDKTCNAVKLYHSPTLYLCAHVGRHSAYKVTNTRRRLHHTTTVKAKPTESVIHSLDNRYICVVSIKGRSSCKLVLFLGKKLAKLLKLSAPIGLSLVKGICKTAPTYILGEYSLLSLGCISALSFKLLYKSYSLNISLVSCLFSIRKVKRIANHKVFALRKFGRLLRDLLCYFFVKLFSSLGSQLIISSYISALTISHA